MIKQKIILLLLGVFSLSVTFAQDKTVKGKVTDVNGEPLIGVSVTAKGLSSATQTNLDGDYSITCPANAMLVFSYIGFNTLELAVAEKSVLNATLTASSKSLEQVVVIGYGSQRKRDLTGSITSVKGSDIEKSPNSNPISSLQGKVAGLTIVNNGIPGTSPTVRVRGVNSTNSSNPIYVVDGVIQTNIDYVNQNDIESIEV